MTKKKTKSQADEWNYLQPKSLRKRHEKQSAKGTKEIRGTRETDTRRRPEIRVKKETKINERRQRKGRGGKKS